MKGTTARAFAMLVALAGFFVLGATGAPAHGDGSQTLVVDDNMACPSADYPSIQVAVTAADPGDVILVCPGVYNEQVTIPKPLTLRGIPFLNENAPIVKPVNAVPNSASLFDPPGPTPPSPIAAIIVADHAGRVDIEGLTLDGSSGGISGCAPNYVGMFYRNSSGHFSHNAVRNVKLAPALAGCQSGLGIFVQSQNGVISDVKIEANTVHDYGKNGITANEAGTKVDIRENTVSGIGVSPDIAQNGIQLAFGATGYVYKNAVINHAWGGCTSTTACPFTASNVLLFDVTHVHVHQNVLGKSQVNVYVEGNRNKIEGNTIFDSDVWDGVDVFGNENQVKGNVINTSDDSAVYMEGDRNQVSSNTINEATVGIWNAAGSNHVGYNRFYNVVQRRLPAPTALNTQALAIPTAEIEETILFGLPKLNTATASAIQP